MKQLRRQTDTETYIHTHTHPTHIHGEIDRCNWLISLTISFIDLLWLLDHIKVNWKAMQLEQDWVTIYIDLHIFNSRLYAVNQYKEEEYVSCVSQEPVMSVYHYAYIMFRMMDCRRYGYSWTTLRSRVTWVPKRLLVFSI